MINLPINSVRAKENSCINYISRKKGDAVMRIETYNQVAQLYQGSRSGKTQKSYDVAAGRDEVTISRAGYDYQIAEHCISLAVCWQNLWNQLCNSLTRLLLSVERLYLP